MKTNNDLTVTQLKGRLRYDPDTGIFTRLYAQGGKPAGSIAGADSKGYVSIRVKEQRYQAHRLAFLWMIGCWPVEQVDHINGVRNDNRWINLRQSTHSENQHNRVAASINKSGFAGVSWHKASNSWRAQIGLNGRRITIGRFPTPELASAAYLKAKGELHPTHMRLRDGR